MKRCFSFLFFCIFSLGLCLAAPLTPEEALLRLSDLQTRSSQDATLAETYKSINGEATLYVFDTKPHKGFIVVSADDAVMPLLGYSDNNAYEEKNLPPELKYWLNEYSRQIQYIRENGLNPVLTRGSIQLPDWKPVEPFIKTKWDQDAPFNKQCPTISGTQAPTGCVATSMAQVMKYYNFPAQGSGSITYTYTLEDKSTKTLSMDFSKVTFDWNNMLDNYNGSYTTTQADAVAALMKAAGYSVEMQYNKYDSGAYSSNVFNSLIDYFNYDPSIRYYNRTWYNYSNWAKMLYDNLSNGQPVIYGGQGTGGAHSFVFDGYLDGYFHVNWGWGGSYDGYFMLDALDPYGVGIGGGSGGFDFFQDAVVNIKPGTSGVQGSPQKMLYAFGNLAGETSLSKLNLYLEEENYPFVVYFGRGAATFNIAAKIEPVNNASGSPLYLPWVSIKFDKNQSGYGFELTKDDPMVVDLSTASLTNNTQYKVTLVYKLSTDSEWLDMPVDQGFYNYVYLTKNNGGVISSYTVDSFPIMQFTAKDMQLASDLYYDLPIIFKGVIANDNDSELTRSVSMVLLVNNDNEFEPAYFGDNFVYSIGPGETVDETWNTTLTPADTKASYDEDTEFYWGLYDYETGYLYYLNETPVTMKSNPGVTYTGVIYVDGASKEGGSFVVEDASDFSVTTEITVQDGMFFNMARLSIFEPIPGTNTAQQVASFDYPLTMIKEGETGKLTIDVSFPQAEVGGKYYIDTRIYVDNQWVLLENPLKTSFIVKGNSSGVGSLMEDPSGIIFSYNNMTGILTVQAGNNGLASVEVYSINGTKLNSSSSGGDYVEIDLNGMPKGIVMVTAIDRQGKRKSAKIVL